MKSIYTVLILILSLVAFSSCTEDEDAPSAASEITTEEAAEIVGTSLASSSAGLTEVSTEVAETSEEVATDVDFDPCGAQADTSYSISSSSGAAISYTGELSYSYAISCENDDPQTFSYEVSYSSSFDAPRMASSNSGSSSLSLVKLSSDYKIFEINGSDSRSGSFESKIFNKTSSDASVSFGLTDLVVDLNAKSITGGTATYTLLGTTATGNTYSINGSVVFNGDGTATIAIQGENFSLDLKTGDILGI